MQLSDILSPERVAIGITAASKKELLEAASHLLSDATGAESQDIFETLYQRERLGSTGLGHGVAIPHGRLDNQLQTIAALVRLGQPIDFDAPDDEPVDLFVVLAVPTACTDVHLNLLAGVAELLGDPERREALRAADSPNTVMALVDT